MSVDDWIPARRERPTGFVAREQRWHTDATGRVSYYPSGPMSGGYAVPNAEYEALQEADQRYEEMSRALQVVLALISILAIGAFYYFLPSHPFLALAVLPASFALLQLIETVKRKFSIAPVLAKLARVPPLKQPPVFRRFVMYLALMIIGGVWIVSYIYDRHIAARVAYSEAIEFYPDIASDLLWAFLCGGFSCLVIFLWKGMVERIGRLMTILSCILLAALGFKLGANAVRHFAHPQPSVVISDGYLRCGWQIPWEDIAGLSLREGRKGSRSVLVELAKPATSVTGRATVETCVINGLNADYNDIYQAIYKKWQLTASRAMPPSMKRGG